MIKMMSAFRSHSKRRALSGRPVKELVRVSCLCSLIVTPALLSAQSGVSNDIFLENERVRVDFARSSQGPRLERIVDRQTGRVHRFEDSEAFGLVAILPETVDDRDFEPEYELQSDLAFIENRMKRSGDVVELDFDHPLVTVTVRYSIEPDEAILRKTITCTAESQDVYIAGVAHWNFVPDAPILWPRGKGGQGITPAVVFSGENGYFATVEWPSVKTTRTPDGINVEHRPGYSLAAGETREVSAGSIGMFSKQSSEQEGLEAARRAFFRHVEDRVKPSFPYPVKFTTWGAWMPHATSGRIFQILDDLKYIGADIFHFDAGWQWPDHPYSERMPGLDGASEREWDLGMTLPGTLPQGFFPVVEALRERDMTLSVWFDGIGNVFMREKEEWAIHDEDLEPVSNQMWARHWPQAPAQSLAGEYGDRFETFVSRTLRMWDLGGIMVDNNKYRDDYSKGRRSMANGWNSVDVQMRKILEIFRRAEEERPGLFIFWCNSSSWPWILLDAHHLHAGDPHPPKDFIGSDYPARLMAYNRIDSWLYRYRRFVPPWGIKGDIAGWSLQQDSPIPLNLDHTDLLVASGEGWIQSLFTCFATTAVRDIRFSFAQVPQFDKDVLKEWLQWDRRRTVYARNIRPVITAEASKGDTEYDGVDVISQVKDGEGVLYYFNRSFKATEVEVTLDESAGFRKSDRDLPAYMVYPMRVAVSGGSVSYGDRLRLPVIGKDCVVIEVGLEKPAELETLGRYEQLSASVRRSHKTIFEAPLDEVIEACRVREGSIRLEAGTLPTDRLQAKELLDGIGAAIGRRIDLDAALAGPRNAEVRLIVGTHEGLSGHPEIGNRFREVMYNRFLEWEGNLISAPLVARLDSSPAPTFCLVAPRPDQLDQLVAEFQEALAEKVDALPEAEGVAKRTPAVTLAIPSAGNGIALRFQPAIVWTKATYLPYSDKEYGDVSQVRFSVTAVQDGRERLLWSEDRAPFLTNQFARYIQLRERILSLEDIAGDGVKLELRAEFLDGKDYPDLDIGFQKVDFVTFSGGEG